MVQLLRFLLVGLANTAVGLLCIWGAMRFLALNEAAANFIGYAFGLVFGFTLNRSWTFSHSEAFSRSFPRWLVVALLAYPTNLAIVLVAHRLGGMDPYFAQPLGIGAIPLSCSWGGGVMFFVTPVLPYGSPNKCQCATGPLRR